MKNKSLLMTPFKRNKDSPVVGGTVVKIEGRETEWVKLFRPMGFSNTKNSIPVIKEKK